MKNYQCFLAKRATKLGGALTIMGKKSKYQNLVGHRKVPHSTLGSLFIKTYGKNLDKKRGLFCVDCIMKKSCPGWKHCPFREEVESEIRKELKRREREKKQSSQLSHQTENKRTSGEEKDD